MPRGRDERIDQAVITAVLDLLRENGYPALTMETIAQRAGTTKPAIRRRWPSQKHVVVAALAAARLGVAEVDTGCLRCDVLAHIEALRKAMADPAFGPTLPGLLADLAADPQLREEFLADFWKPRREACLISLERARSRGSIRTELDLDVVIDLVAAPVAFRALFGHLALDDKFCRDVTDAVLSGVGTDDACQHGE